MRPLHTRPFGRKGMELSINTLVVIILGMLILGGGFLLLKQIDTSTRDLLKDVGASTQQRIDKELTGGSLIAIPDNTRTGIEYGIQHFALGFKNKMTLSHLFRPEFKFREAFTEDGVDTGLSEADGNALLFHRDFEDPMNYFTLAPNEAINDIAFSITIPRGSPKGTYVYEVTIYYNKTMPHSPGDIYAKKQVRITLN